MREPWEVFAAALTITLLGALIVTGVVVGDQVITVARTDGGMAELAGWRQGSRADSSVPSGGRLNGAESETAPVLAMVMFACIPIITYAAGLVGFLRRRRYPYVIMTAIQLVLLLALAVPTLVALLQ